MKYEPEIAEACAKRYAAGLSTRYLAEHHGVSEQTIRGWLARVERPVARGTAAKRAHKLAAHIRETFTAQKCPCGKPDCEAWV